MHWPLWRVAVAEQSMEPGLRPGDWLLAWRGLRRSRPPRIRPGQVVVAEHPARPGFLLVKRAARRTPDGWWLESDNQAVPAVDSRVFGPVPDQLINGRVLVRYRRAPFPSRARKRRGPPPHAAGRRSSGSSGGPWLVPQRRRPGRPAACRPTRSSISSLDSLAACAQ